MLRDLIQDLRYGWRGLRRRPGAAAIVVLSLALGIGASGALFSLANALFLAPLPVVDPGRLVLLSHPGVSGRSDGIPRGRLELFSPRLYQRVRGEGQGRFFSGLAAQDSGSTGAFVEGPGPRDGGGDARATGRTVSDNYFSVLGVPAHRGRTFLPEDSRALEPASVMVISHDYWQRRFGGAPAVVGARVTVNGRPVTVVGIAAPAFSGLNVGQPTDFWLPLELPAGPAREFRRDDRWLLVLGRLAPGVAAPAAEADANLALQRYLADDPVLAADPSARQGVKIELDPAGQGVSPLRESFRDPLLVLLAGVGVLLLIVCLNVSHLLLARAIDRQREMNIRAALGASRWRLVRQLLVEAILLSGLGAAGGLLLTGWLADGLLLLAGVGGPLALEVGLDRAVLTFVTALAATTGVAIGLAPAWQVARASLQPALRATAQTVTLGGARRLVSRVLLVSQVALSLVLLFAAGLLAGSLGQLRRADKGIDEQRVLLMGVNRSLLADLREEQAPALTRAILDRVEQVPGVRSASLSAMSPLGNARTTEMILIDGRVGSAPVRLDTVTADYFATLGIRLIRGRAFGAGDAAGGPRIVVVNEALARLFPGGAAVGQRLRFDPVSSPSQPPGTVEIVGVVRDARNAGLRAASQPMVYRSAAQHPGFLGSLAVNTSLDPASLGEPVRRAVLQAHPGLRVVGVRTMRAQVDRLLVQERLLAVLSTGFGLAALFLMSLGLFGILSQWAGQRTREIGVRVALGATRGSVRWLVLRQALALVLAGVALGLPAAWGASRLLRGLLFGLSPTDPARLAVAALLMFGVALAAGYLPARRASRVDPMRALRSE